MQTSDQIAAISAIIAGLAFGLSIWSLRLAHRADRRSKVQDVPVINVTAGNSDMPEWEMLTIEVDNQTAGTWTLETIEWKGNPSVKLANGAYVMMRHTSWRPEEDARSGPFACNRQISSGSKETVHLYSSRQTPASQNAADPGSPSTGAPSLRQAITQRFSSRALRISFTKHAWSVERHVLYVRIKTHS